MKEDLRIYRWWKGGKWLKILLVQLGIILWVKENELHKHKHLGMKVLELQDFGERSKK